MNDDVLYWICRKSNCRRRRYGLCQRHACTAESMSCKRPRIKIVDGYQHPVRWHYKRVVAVGSGWLQKNLSKRRMAQLAVLRLTKGEIK